MICINCERSLRSDSPSPIIYGCRDTQCIYFNPNLKSKPQLIKIRLDKDGKQCVMRTADD